MQNFYFTIFGVKYGKTDYFMEFKPLGGKPLPNSICDNPKDIRYPIFCGESITEAYGISDGMIWNVGSPEEIISFQKFQSGATQDYETLISRLFETFFDFETKKQVVPWHQWHHLVRRHWS